MTHFKLIKTLKHDGMEIPFGVMCETEECLNIHKPKGCHNCPMQRAIFQKLKFLEEIIEKEEDGSITV